MVAFKIQLPESNDVEFDEATSTETASVVVQFPLYVRRSVESTTTDYAIGESAATILSKTGASTTLAAEC